MTPPPRVLLAEADGALRLRLCGYLRVHAFEVLEAPDGLVALSLVADQRPDVALIDIALPALDGLRLLRRIRQHSTLPVIALTASRDPAERIAALEAGADDALLKPYSLREVAARLRAQVRRARAFQDAGSLDGGDERHALRAGAVELDVRGRRCLRSGQEVALTRREFDLLGALLRQPGCAHTREQLLKLVWGTDDVVAKTVDVHISALRRKLGPAIRVTALRGVGYRLDPA